MYHFRSVDFILKKASHSTDTMCANLVFKFMAKSDIDVRCNYLFRCAKVGCVKEQKQNENQFSINFYIQVSVLSMNFGEIVAQSKN